MKHPALSVLRDATRGVRGDSPRVVPRSDRGFENVAGNSSAQADAARRRRSRSGWALAELVVVVAIAAVIAGVSVPVVLRLWQADRELKAEFAWQRSVRRLARQWRADVPKANRLEMESGGELVKLVGKDRSVSYRLGSDELVRTAELGTHRSFEGYGFPQGTSATCAFGPYHRTLRMRLRIPCRRNVSPQRSGDPSDHVVIEMAAALPLEMSSEHDSTTGKSPPAEKSEDTL